MNGLKGIPRLKKTIIAVSSLTLLLGSGCARIKFAYNRVDWLLLPRLKSYVTFTKEQNKAIDTEFHNYMRWHRREMLPGYALLLQHAAQAIDRPVSFNVKDAQGLRNEFKMNFDKTLRPFLAGTSRILVTLDQKQIEELEKKFHEEDVKFKEKYLDVPLEKQIEKRDKNIIDLLEFFTGDLSKDQRVELKQGIAKLPSISIQWLESRRKWRDGLKTLLVKKKPAKEIEAFLSHWFIDRAWINTPELKKFNAEFEAASDQFMVSTVKLLKENQRRKSRKIILGFAQEFEELNRERVAE